MTFPESHAPLIVNDKTFDLSHLNAFSTVITGKGMQTGTDLNVYVCFSNHVFTYRAKHGEKYDLLDHHGSKRRFDLDRYNFSQSLPSLLKSELEKDGLTFVSRSFGGIDNLILLQMAGRTWTVVFCFEPIECGVRMEILSSHPKDVNQAKISRKQISYFARTCAFTRERIPKI